MMEKTLSYDHTLTSSDKSSWTTRSVETIILRKTNQPLTSSLRQPSNELQRKIPQWTTAQRRIIRFYIDLRSPKRVSQALYEKDYYWFVNKTIKDFVLWEIEEVNNKRTQVGVM